MDWLILFGSMAAIVGLGYTLMELDPRTKRKRATSKEIASLKFKVEKEV